MAAFFAKKIEKERPSANRASETPPTAKPNNMPIIAHICDSVKEYQTKGNQAINSMVASGQFKCPICFQPLKISSRYERDIKETGETIEVVVLRYSQRCGKGNALLPDFISP